jgi:hypothetical protein
MPDTNASYHEFVFYWIAKILWELNATLLWANILATINITSPYI